MLQPLRSLEYNEADQSALWQQMSAASPASTKMVFKLVPADVDGAISTPDRKLLEVGHLDLLRSVSGLLMSMYLSSVMPAGEP